MLILSVENIVRIGNGISNVHSTGNDDINGFIDGDRFVTETFFGPMFLNSSGFIALTVDSRSPRTVVDIFFASLVKI